MTVGAAGGPKIITQSLLATIRFIELDMTLKEAVANPRYHHQWSPDRILLERSMPYSFEKKLNQMGHRTVRSGSVGVTQAIAIDQQGVFVGVHDPRVPGKAGGY